MALATLSSPPPTLPPASLPSTPLPLLLLPMCVPQGCALRGDGKPCALPTLENEQPFQTVAASTITALLQGHYPQIRFVIIDCRYPFEYDAGHIANAINVWTEEQLEDLFFGPTTEGEELRSQGQDTVFIFHCEFSSHRAPKLLQSLRNRDRQRHVSEYPLLSFPEAYLLKGGYAHFFQQHPDVCSPRAYCPMLAPEHRDALATYQRAMRRGARALRTLPPPRPSARLDVSSTAWASSLLRRLGK